MRASITLILAFKALFADHLPLRLNETYSREAFIKASGATPAVYQDAFGTICNILGITFEVPIEEVATALHVEECLELASNIKEQFSTRFAAQTVIERRKEIRHNKVAVDCACLALAAEVFKKELKVPDMLQMTAITRQVFDVHVRQIRELTLNLAKRSGSGQSDDPESEILGSAPAKKKHKGATGAASNGARLPVEPVERPPKITLDTPIDKDLEEKIKQEDESFVAKLMKVSVLVAAATSVDTKSQTTKNKEDDERLRKWRESVISKSNSAPKPESANVTPKKQSTINFAKASPSSSSAP